METLDQFFTKCDYRELLRDELTRRQNRNARYSLRAFSRQIGISHNRLSEILRGKQGLSPRRARVLAGRLWGSEPYINFFTDLVTVQHARKTDERMEAERRVSTVQSSLKSLMGDGTQIAPLLSWLELVSSELKQGSVTESVASALDSLVSEDFARSVAKLMTAGYIEISKSGIQLKFPSSA